MESIEVAAEFKVSPKRLYEAWLDGKQHSAFTGGAEASVEARVGGEHTAWDGYIWGKIVTLEPHRRFGGRLPAPPEPCEGTPGGGR